VPYKILNEAGDWLVQVQRNGERRSLRGTGGERKAKEAEAELRAEMARGQKVEDAESLLGVSSQTHPTTSTLRAKELPTLRGYFEERWLKHAAVVQNLSTRMKSQYPTQYLLFYLGDRRLDELTESSVVNGFIEVMKEKGPLSFFQRKDGKPARVRCAEFSNATINKSLTLLRAVLNLAHNERVLSIKPKIDLLPEEDSTAVVAVSEKQFQTLVKTCELYRDVAPLMPEVVEFAADTGLRVGEVFHLTFGSVDIGRVCVRIETQRHTRVINGRAWKPKNCKVREVPLSKRALEIVKARLVEGPSSPTDRVFPSFGGAPYVRVEVSDELKGKGFFRDAVAEAGLKGVVTFHGLRHLFAVRLLTRGVPISVVSELLGHTDINLTVKRYGRFASDAKVRWDAVRVLD